MCVHNCLVCPIESLLRAFLGGFSRVIDLSWLQAHLGRPQGCGAAAALCGHEGAGLHLAGQGRVCSLPWCQAASSPFYNPEPTVAQARPPTMGSFYQTSGGTLTSSWDLWDQPAVVHNYSRCLEGKRKQNDPITTTTTIPDI